MRGGREREGEKVGRRREERREGERDCLTDACMTRYHRVVHKAVQRLEKYVDFHHRQQRLSPSLVGDRSVGGWMGGDARGRRETTREGGVKEEREKRGAGDTQTHRF
jgi:hypothetical protein